MNLLRREATSEEQQQAVTPRINSSVCDEEFFDRVESPFLPISSPREVGSPFQRWPRVHTGTSSLRYVILLLLLLLILHNHHHHDGNDDDQEEGGRRWEPRRKPGGHSFPVSLPPHQRQSLQVAFRFTFGKANHMKIDDHKETENSDILSCQRVEGNSDYGVNDSDDNNNDIFVSAS